MISRITKKKTQELLRSSLLEKRDDLKITSYDSSLYYSLQSGAILVDLKDGARHSLFIDTETEYREYINKITSLKPEYILAGFPADPAGFLSLVEKSLEVLKNLLGIYLKNYDYSSLKRIDKALKKERITYTAYKSAFFLWIVPFVSKCVLDEENGNWHFTFNSKHKVAEPYIVLPNGKTINVFVDLSEEAMEDFKHFSVYAISQLRIQKL